MYAGRLGLGGGAFAHGLICQRPESASLVAKWAQLLQLRKAVLMPSQATIITFKPPVSIRRGAQVVLILRISKHTLDMDNYLLNLTNHYA